MKSILLMVCFGIILTACGSGDPHDRLRKLESERDELNKQIEQLRAEIAGMSDTTDRSDLPHVTVLQVEPELFRHYIRVQGTVESDNNILIPARSSGVVKKINVSQGTVVRKGDVLAELDGAILENTIDELEINLELAATMYQRQKRLWEKKIGSEMQYLQSKTNMEALKKRLAATREQYLLTKVIAPISGSVDEILIKEGEAVAAGFGTIRVVKLSQLKISADVSEEYTGRIRVGDSVRVRVPVLNRELSSTVRSVSRVIDPRNRTFPIEVDLPRDSRDIQPNMLTVLIINDYSNPDALTVPVNILQKTGSSMFLFTAEKREGEREDIWTVFRRTVTIGLKQDDRVEITAGLNAQEHVVVRGFQDLAHEQQVVAGEDF